MSNDGHKSTTLPAWLSEALEGDVIDDRRQRGTDRHVWVRLASVEAKDSATRFSAKIVNVSPEGLGLICREYLLEGDRLTVTPDGVAEDGSPYDCINVRVMHCTDAIQGYKVGCLMD